MEMHVIRSGEVHRTRACAPLGRRHAVFAAECARERFVRGVAGLESDVEDPERPFEQPERGPL